MFKFGSAYVYTIKLLFYLIIQTYILFMLYTYMYLNIRVLRNSCFHLSVLECDFRDELKLYGRTSDRELHDPKLEIVTAKPSINFEKSDFYDPNYGFSKEAIASLGIFDKEKTQSEIGALETENQKRPATIYHRQIYNKYPDVDKGIKNNLQPIPQNTPLSTNPLKYLRSFIEKTPSDSSQSSSHEQESFVKTDLIDYEQYFKKLNDYARPAYSDNFKGFKPSSDEGDFGRPAYPDNFKGFKPSSDEGDLGRYQWQAGVDGRPQRQHYDFSKLYDDDAYKRYASELYDQQRAVGEYLSKFANSAEYDLGSSEVDDDYDSLKFRDNRKPRRGRRPSNNARNKPRGTKSSTVCVGPRCNNRVRRPRFTPF